MQTSDKITIVSCLYDINRGDGRTIENYFLWMPHLLKIQHPVVIFTTSNFSERIKKMRGNLPISIVELPFENLLYFEFLERMKQNSKGRDQSKLEYKNPKYGVVIHSKLHLMQKASESNIYDSEYFIWVDAGYFRPEQNAKLCTSLNPEKFYGLGDKFLLLCRNNERIITTKEFSFGQDDRIGELSDDQLKKVCSDNRRPIMASVMAGNVKSIKRTFQLHQAMFNRMIKLGKMATEEHLLTAMAMENENYFATYKVNNHRKNLYDFSFLGVSRLQHKIEENLEVFTVVSKEIHQDAVKCFTESCSILGYKFKLLARDQKFGGWSWRTQRYLEAIKQSKAKVVIICDSTDLFFIGPATEMYRKYKNDGREVIITAESCFAYAHSGRATQEVSKSFFDNLNNKIESRYPNGGFLIGKREELERILENNIRSPDDQAGYYDMIREGEKKLHLDYTCKFSACIPSTGFNTPPLGKRWDMSDTRIKCKESGEYPCALHFPGRNFKDMGIIFQKCFGVNSEEIPWDNDPSPFAVSLLLFCIILMFFLIRY